MDTRDIYKLVRELSEEKDSVINLYDSMDIELNEGFVIETGVVGFTEDGVIVHLDEDALEFLDLNGILTESVSEAEIVSRDEFDNVTWRGDDLDSFKAKVAASQDAFEMIYGAISGDYGEEIRNAIQEMYDDVVIDSAGRLHPDDDFEEIIKRIVDHIDADSGDMSIANDVGGVDPEAAGWNQRYSGRVDELAQIKKLALGESWAYSDHNDSRYDDEGDASPRDKARAQARRDAEAAGWSTDDDRENDAELDEGLGKALLGGAALIAAITGINKYQADQMMKTEPQLITLSQMRQEAEMKGDTAEVEELDDRIQQTMDHIKVTGRPVMDPQGNPVDPRKPYAGESIEEAEYQGRKVPLNKPMAGDVKKSKVYVKKPNGKVVKVNFGDKNMRIKKSNPNRRKSFRARHNCDNPGPKWKARYWSCRAW
jgi:hypothetical protein